MGEACKPLLATSSPPPRRGQATPLRVVFPWHPLVTIPHAQFSLHLTLVKYLPGNIKKAIRIYQGDGCHGFSTRFEVVAAPGGGGLLPQARRGGRIPASQHKRRKQGDLP